MHNDVTGESKGNPLCITCDNDLILYGCAKETRNTTTERSLTSYSGRESVTGERRRPLQRLTNLSSE